jgi:quercetin dioxygenase-like cupin family protein
VSSVRSLATTAVTLLALALTAAAANPAQEDPNMLAYTHLYSDANGVSHFKTEHLEFKRLDSPNAPASLTAHLFSGVQGATLLRLKSGALEDWHAAPRTQFLVGVQGESEVTAGDGKTLRVKPGDVVLMDDTTGKGHRTAAVGAEDHIALVVPVSAAQ